MSEIQNTFLPSVEKRRILIVEDEFINQEILKAILIDSYDVITATTGTEALDILSIQYETISLILLDLNLPDIHGLDVLRKIKSDTVLTRLPVIVMTADSEAEVESLSLGAIDFIPKPYPQQKVILARILRTIELSEDRDILRWTERDHLTGLYNYNAFDILFHGNEHKQIAVLAAEIDDYSLFKREKGQEYVDRVVCRVADVLRGNFRSMDQICRLREDKFVIIMANMDSKGMDLISSKIDRINHELRKNPDGLATISMSVGVAFSDREKTEGNVFQDADTALERMKEIRMAGYAVY